MSKQMLDENLMKISERADRIVTDTAQAGILLCYMLYRLDEPLDTELLYDIAVTGGIINYFTFQDAMQSLLDSGSIRKEKSKDGMVCLLTSSGIECAKRLKTMAGKSYRDEIVSAAKRAVIRHRNAKDVRVSYEELETGCHLLIDIQDGDLTLLELKLYAPDRQQAELLAEGVMNNPAALYRDVMQAMFRRQETPIDLTDN